MCQKRGRRAAYDPRGGATGVGRSRDLRGGPECLGPARRPHHAPPLRLPSLLRAGPAPENTTAKPELRIEWRARRSYAFGFLMYRSA